MGDDLTISGSGSMAVATDELYAAAAQLRGLAREAASLRSQLGAIDALVTPSTLQAVGAPFSAARAELDLDQAMIVMFELEQEARVIDWALGTVADGYGFVERFVGQLGQQVAGGLAVLAGGALGSAAVASAVAAGGAIGAARLAGHPVTVDVTPTAFARRNNEFVTNPLTVGFVRTAAQNSGAFALGAAGVPYALATALRGMGLGGPATGAGSLLNVGAAIGLLKETPVQLASSGTTSVDAPPSGYLDRLDRVPDPESNGGSQVVIERYEMADGPTRFEVYVAGTVTFSPTAEGEPWDMASNLSNAAGDEGGSYASVAAAMKLAGIDEASPVQFTGYSQGGATVARLAASGDYNVQGFASFGAPTGQIPIPAGFPTVIVEHTDDIVPALGGVQVNQQAVIVEREVFAGRDIPEQYAVPAHHLEYYEETARLMDDAASPQITGAIARLDAFGQGFTSVTSTAYRFERVPEPAVSGTSGGR